MGGDRWVDTLDACAVRDLPRPRRPADADRHGDDGRRERTAALAAAYHGARPEPAVVGIAWYRPSAATPVEVFAVGDVAGSRAADGTRTLRLPAGARATAVPPGWLAATLRRMPAWTRLTATADALMLDVHGHPPALSLPESLLSIWHEPFAWLVVATAVPAEEITEAGLDVATAARDAKARAAGSPDHAVRLTRLENRLAELRRASSTGLWRVRLLAGGVDARSAHRIGALLAASADLSGLPYALVPTEAVGALDDLPDEPFTAPSPLVAALLEPPRREVAGLRLRLLPDFDTTPETATVDGAAIVHLGRVLDTNGATVGPLPVSTASLVRHVFVAGATGAGKSQTVRHLLEEVTAVGIPWLVIEPSKAEYRAMAARLPDVPVLVIRPGDLDAPPAGINPLEPAAGFPMQTHVDLVRALFNAAFDAEEPFPQVLSAALVRCYEALGWHLTLGRPRDGVTRPRYPTLADLQRAAEDVVTDIGYGREVTDNVRGFIRIRLGSLRLGTTGRFFEGGHPLDFGAVLRNRVVFELEDVGDDQDKAFLMGTLLIRLIEHLRVDRRRAGTPSPDLRHLTVIEEAHRLLRRQDDHGPGAHAVEMFASLLAEIRAYGEGIVIAEQIPTKLIGDVIKNTAVKVLHRLPARDDRDAVGATMNLTEAQSTYLVTLPPGTAAMFADGMDYPVLARLPDGTAREAAPAVPGAVVGLVGRRSATCGFDCHRRPCTLTEIETARELPGDWWRLWAELCVIAHLTGWATPYPVDSALAAARDLPARARDCVVGHLADAAVGARSTLVAGSDGPDGLAAHVARVLRDRLAGAPSPCLAEEPEWLARPFRWCLVWDTLKQYVTKRPDAPRHPRTAEWERRYGRSIPGADAAAQLALVQQWYQADERDVAARRAVFFGGYQPSTVEQAVGGTVDGDAWPAHLDQALATFPDAHWARRYLITPGGTA